MITRRTFLLGAGGLFGAALAGGGYAVAIEPRFRLRVQTWRIEPDGWPAELSLRIVAIADPHLGAPVMPIERWRRIVEIANTLSGDLIVFLGDFIGSHRFVTETYPVEAITAVAAEAAAPLGRFAILGNHDWWSDGEAQARGGGPTAVGRALAAAGLPVLENDAVRLFIARIRSGSPGSATSSRCGAAAAASSASTIFPARLQGSRTRRR